MKVIYIYIYMIEQWKQIYKKKFKAWLEGKRIKHISFIIIFIYYIFYTMWKKQTNQLLK